jgi:hypothetical protein
MYIIIYINIYNWENEINNDFLFLSILEQVLGILAALGCQGKCVRSPAALPLTNDK